MGKYSTIIPKHNNSKYQNNQYLSTNNKYYESNIIETTNYTTPGLLLINDNGVLIHTDSGKQVVL